MTTETIPISADAAAGASLPIKREPAGVTEDESPSKIMRTDAPQSIEPSTTIETENKVNRNDADKALNTRKLRLEQNRKAAKESRRRKKIMIEELQRSVCRANFI